MKILVLGAGAVGGYFGGRLAEAGADVAFLVRDRRAKYIADHGLVIRSPIGDAKLLVRTLTAHSEPEDFDLVILTCKAYDLVPAMNAVAPHVSAGNGLVLPLLNGIAHIDTLKERFGPDRVIGGMCQIFAALSSEGEVCHLDKPARLFFGRFQDQMSRGVLEQQAQNIATQMAKANFTSKLVEPIEQSLWDKWMMLAAMAGATCLMRGSVGHILKTDDGKAILLEIVRETAAVTKAAGYPPSESYLENVRTLLTTPNTAAKASMLRDMERDGDIEAHHLIGDLLRRARDFGVATPILRLANCHLQTYEAERRDRAKA